MLVADDVAGQEREHRAHFRARGIAIKIAVERADLPDLDLARRAASVLRAGEDMRLRILDILGRQPVVGENAVGGLSRGLQRLGMRGGKKDRGRALDPRQMCACRAERGRLALQQGLDEGHAFREILGAGLRQSHVLGAAVTGADAEHRAAVGDVIERCDRRRAHRGMPGEEIGDAERDPRALRGAGHHRGRYPRVHRVSGRIGDADHRVAVAVCALSEFFAQIEVIRPEEETNLHLALFL